jgi:hypothetical protein
LNAEVCHNRDARELGCWSGEALQAVFGAEVIKGGAGLVKGAQKAAKASKKAAQGAEATKSVGKAAESIEKGAARATQAGKVGEVAKGSNQQKAAVKKTEVLLPQELRGGEISESNLMIAAEKWLGQGYKDKGNGRYLSEDGLRQFRYGKHETKNIMKQHAHIEAYDRPHEIGGKLIEKAVLDVIE